MKRLFYLAAIALISSCAGGNGYTITGAVEGIEVGDTVELFNYSESMPEEALAMAVVENVGEFTLSGEAESSSVGVLMVNGYMTIGAVVVEAGEISVVLDQGAIKIAGTPLNDANAEIETEVLAFRQKFNDLDSTLSPD